MSFILDALRKSESERQREAAPTLVRAPLAMARQRTPGWVWVMIALLAACLAAMAALLVSERTDNASVVPPAASSSAESGDITPVRAPASGVAPNQAVVQAGEAPPQSTNATSAGTSALSVETPAPPPRRISALDSIDPSLAGMSVNMIAYDTSEPSNRFVWISGRRYLTGELVGGIAEIIEIREDSVILATGTERFELDP